MPPTVIYDFNPTLLLTENTKKDTVDRQQAPCKVEGKESIDNTQAVGYNHRQSTDESQGTKGKGALQLGLFDLGGRLVDEHRRPTRDGTRLSLTHKRRSFRHVEDDDDDEEEDWERDML